MESGAVVEGFDVIEDGGASLGVGGEALMIDQFVFEGAKEGFDEGVIVAVAFAAHGRDQTMLGQTCRQTGWQIDAYRIAENLDIRNLDGCIKSALPLR